MRKKLAQNRESQWFYHSGVPARLPEAARALRILATPPSRVEAFQLADAFKIEFATDQCAPNHLVTLRTEVDGWGRDIYGVYTGGTWTFTLEKALYANGVVFKFMLDGCHWAKGLNMSVAPPHDVRFDDQAVQFDTIEPRYLHHYDNLQVSDNDNAQAVMHANHDETIEYDLIVVGSGMVGGVLALKAAQRGLKVLILDAGSLEYSTHTFNLPNTDWGALATQNQVVNYTRADAETSIIAYPTMNFGGRSVYWYGIIPRMKSWELGFWPPTIGVDLNAGLYDAAEALMRKHSTTGPFQESVIGLLQPLFPNHVVCDTPRSDHQPNIGQGSFIEQSTGTFSTAELLYDALTAAGSLGSDNLFVNLNHLVTRLEWTNRKIDRVVCQDLVGNCERAYRGKVVVLAAGSIQTPRIALSSQLTNPNGLTGVGLTDHGSYFSKRFTIPAGSAFAGNEKHARIFFYADPTQQHRFNTEVELNDDYFHIRHANLAYWQDYLNHKNETFIRLKFTCATPLIDSNFVRLAANPDDKVSVRMPRNNFGKETRPAVEALGAGILNFFGVQNFDLTKDDQLGFGNEGTPQHAGGTMRMSANSSGVVNTDLRHESYDNLYVCDASVFPFIPAANPSLTLVALAIRLDTHLASLP